MKDRASLLFLERGNLDVLDGAFVIVDKTGTRTQIPIGGIACLLLEPGTRVSHRAAALAAEAGCLLVWVGEAGVRIYSAGRPGGARSDRLLHQAAQVLDDRARLKVVRKMYAMRFGEEPPARRSIEQLRGIEGARVRTLYKELAAAHGVTWHRRNYDRDDWETADAPNRCLSAATSCLYGVTEAAILAAGYSPALGFIHSGKPLSFVYDIADLVKFETVVPVAFRTASEDHPNPERIVRHRCRDAFRKTRLLEKIIPMIELVLDSGGQEAPAAPYGSIAPVLIEEDEFD